MNTVEVARGWGGAGGGINYMLQYLTAFILFIHVFWHIPTTTKRYIVDDAVVEEYSASSVGLGVAYKPIVKSMLDDRVSFRLQTALMLGAAINSTEHRFFPIAVVRPSLATPKGFSMYLGSALSLQVESIALIYGVSQLF